MMLVLLEFVDFLLHIHYDADVSLVSLSEITDSSRSGSRIERIIVSIVNDIKICQNVCDTYSKKSSSFGRVFKGLYWKSKFASLAGIFAKRKEELDSAMLLYVTMRVAKLGTEVTKKVDRDVSKKYVRSKCDILLLSLSIDEIYSKTSLRKDTLRQISKYEKWA